MSRLSLLPAVGRLLFNRAALTLKLRKPRDGWRRAAGLVLRHEESTFILSAFGLDSWSDAPSTGSVSTATAQRNFAQRLHAFLMAEPDLHAHILHTREEDFATPSTGPAYTLRIEPAASGPARFLPPSDWSGARIDHLTREHPNSLPLLNIVARLDAGNAVDIWLRVNHVAADGVPVQEALNRLEAEWGVKTPVLFPTPESFSPFTTPRPLAGTRAGCAIVQTFLDFAPLLAWRKQQNAKLPAPLTVSAALMWRLALHPHFRPFYIGTTAEVAPSDVYALARGVGMVVARPSEFQSQPEDLARFAALYSRELELTRQRASQGCKLLDAAAFLPAHSARALLHRGLQDGTTAFGSLGITMLKDAKVFGAPLAETGHDNGFIAIGSLALPTGSGRAVGCVTIKGPADRIADYPRLLTEALNFPI
jgi:hypothetical protein